MMKSNIPELLFNSMLYKSNLSIKCKVFIAVKSSIFMFNFNLPKFWKKVKL